MVHSILSISIGGALKTLLSPNRAGKPVQISCIACEEQKTATTAETHSRIGQSTLDVFELLNWYLWKKRTFQWK